MKILAIILPLLIVAAALAVLYLKYRLDNTPDNKDLEAALDSEVTKLIHHDASYGMVIGVYKDGKSFIKGYGTVNKESATVPSASTVFQIASVSKVFTASLLQILCDEGVVSIDATLGELIGHSMPLSPAVQQVTLRQLSTHTSGFPSIPKSLGVKATEVANGDDPLLDPFSYLGPQYVFDYLATAEDKKAAGRFEYSNFGMGLLAHVLEVVTGKDYESLIKEKILAPLGMGGTGITLTPEMQAHLAQGYTAKGAPTRVWHFAALAGAGAINSNAQDMLRFIQANVEEGGPLSLSFKKMREPQFKGDTGIGWIQPNFMDRFFGIEQVVWHNGMVAGYASYLSIDAKAKTGIVVLSNKGVDVTMLGMKLTRQARTQSWSSQNAF